MIRSAHPGRDGTATVGLIGRLLHHQLVDETTLLVCPVIGQGHTRLFPDRSTKRSRQTRAGDAGPALEARIGSTSHQLHPVVSPQVRHT